jgi:hypothetical protein
MKDKYPIIQAEPYATLDVVSFTQERAIVVERGGRGLVGAYPVESTITLRTPGGAVCTLDVPNEFLEALLSELADAEEKKLLQGASSG